LKKKIDILVLKDKLWLAVIESKQTQFSFSMAIPQALAYMVGHPEQDQPVYGLVTNGDSFLFIKLYQSNYGFSTDYSIYGLPNNELYQVLQVLRKLS
jgi:predicted type IV restriction endonuclease